MTQYKADHDAPSLRNKLGDTFDVHVKPNAASNQVQLLSISDDSVQISVRVTASPERGKANQAVIRLLAKELGLPKSRLEIIRGQYTRKKTVQIRKFTNSS